MPKDKASGIFRLGFITSPVTLAAKVHPSYAQRAATNMTKKFFIKEIPVTVPVLLITSGFETGF